MLEREGLRIESGGNGKPTTLHFNPRNFSPIALAEIIYYQSVDSSPKQFVIFQKENTPRENADLVTPEEIGQFNQLEPEKRRMFLIDTIRKVRSAEKVIIERIGSTEDANKPDSERKKANKTSQSLDSEKELFIHRMLKTPNEVLVLERSRLDMLRH